MDQKVQAYMNFMKNYTERLEQRGTDWLGPKDLGDVLLTSAMQNGMKRPDLRKGKMPNGKKDKS